jgi:CheY-like chemotaxis protein
MLYQNILHIDDDSDDQELFLTAISQVSPDFNCVALSDATEALQQLKERTITPDVIFLDLNMPVMNGEQFLVEIKKDEALKNIPVIIFSTSSQPHTIKLTKELGASDFITKPDRYQELVKLLRSFLMTSS